MTYETLNECQKRAVIQLSSFLAMPSQKHMIIEGASGVKLMAPYTAMYS